jgi:hypothetical protein
LGTISERKESIEWPANHRSGKSNG